MKNTKLSVAIHTLILISESEVIMSSDDIAKSVNTNSSYIRKIMALLKSGGVLTSRQGVSGASLAIPKEKLTLLKIYQAVEQTENVHVLDIHDNPNDACIVGKYITPVLMDVFAEVESEFAQRLKRVTLGDCIERIAEKSGYDK